MAGSETGYAKLNLALHVRARRDTYHEIETLFVFCEDGDRLTWRAEPGLEVTGEFAGALAGEGDNLVLRAQRGFTARFGAAGEGGFLLDKRLPVASGIGGGSADAAAVLRLLCGRHGIDPRDEEVEGLAAELGADVPACLRSMPVRGTGRGDMLTAIAGFPRRLPVLLVNPMRPLATGAVFARWDGVDRGALAEGDPLAVAQAGRNDLEPPALALLPAIGAVLTLLRAQPGATLVRMSGSGATCFALFDGVAQRDAADADIAAARPGWWRFATRLR